MNERWATIPQHPNYEVSSHGRVRHAGTRHVRVLWTNQRGYVTVVLYRGDIASSFRVHALVLSAFVGPRPAGHHGAHLDGNRANNRIENLEWVTPRENERHKLLHGTRLVGERHPNAKLSVPVGDAIRMSLECGATVSHAAREFGVSRKTIRRVRAGAWVGMP